MSDEAAVNGPEGQEPQNTGTPPEVEELKAKLDEFRENNRDLYNKLKRFEGIDPDEVKSLREESKKLKNRLESTQVGVDDDEIQELVNKRLQKEYGQAIEKANSEVESWKEKHSATSERLAEVLLDNEVTMAAKSLDDFIGPATADAIRLVRESFTVEDGKAVHKEGARDEDGNPLTVSKFLSWTKKPNSDVYRPHWWKATASGGGATGNQGNATGKDVKTREEFERLNPKQKMEFMRRVRDGKAEMVGAA